mmetsp:Transcript_15005/g.7304  ORF Transcript_15005/g.7304 Transcript_15005/m.7304 type:complete len:99 (+) Transcript_15005:179-475(+)
MDSNEAYRNMSGIVFVGSVFSKETVNISNCNLYRNCESGLSVLNYDYGIVNVIKCRVYENVKSGLVLSNCLDIRLFDDEIFHNKQYGILMSQINCNVS